MAKNLVDIQRSSNLKTRVCHDDAILTTQVWLLRRRDLEESLYQICSAVPRPQARRSERASTVALLI